MLAALGLAVALVAWNTVTNRRPSRESTYLLRNTAAALVLLVVARVAGLSWADLGLGAEAVGAGWRWGGLAVLLAAVGAAALGALAGAWPRLRPALADPRADLSPGRLAFQVLVRIPLGTALFEELAFRGVLQAVAAEAVPVASAVALQGVAFGLWHVGPTRLALRERAHPSEPPGQVRTITAAVVVTAVAGVVLGILRAHTGSLLAPVLAHAAVNAFGLLLAAALHRR